MSWELVSFLILGAVLLGGFAWYERSRPPAQVVALVAALAALAIAGRIAFAAFPNVKPTTDIVIFAGYALGPAPGFAVGALAALVSNFWFGQGPWTPWQMAGWGLCGVLGAALALGGRNAGRFSLAATCGLAGVLYGALLNFSLMATYGGELSLERFGVLSARAIPFDAAHAVGNVALALVAGPAIVRMLARFRQRFEWQRGGSDGAPPEPPDRPPRRMRPALRGGGVAALIVVSVLLAVLAPGRAEAAGADRAELWLISVQNDDGGFGSSPDDGSGPEMTAWAMLGLAAAGRNAYDLSRGGHSPVTYLQGHLGELDGPGDLARTILALLSAGANPREFGGRNLVEELRGLRFDNGSYERWPNSTAFAVIALRTAGAPGGTEKSLEWLRNVQNDDGGWGNEPGQSSDAEATSSVLQALSPDSEASGKGLKYLRDAQQGNGGYRVGRNGAINTQATAWAIQGILAAGGDPGSVERNGSTPFDYLAANQADNGHYRYSKSSDQTPVWVTGQVLVAVSRDYFPVAAPPRRRPDLSSSSGTGGAAPPLSGAPVSPAPALEVPQAPSPATGSGSGAGASEPPGATAPGGAAAPVPGGATSPPEATEGAEPPSEANPSEAAESASETAADESGGDDSGVGGAIGAGLLAGGLLVGAGLLARKGWMRWRYGL
jgi:energy-coupling factor transport system substrate-specific component